MPANRFNGFTEYGVGIGLRIPHYQHILTRKPVVDWFEIISENYMIDGGRPLEILDKILDQYNVVQHGVSMYFGSASDPDPEHLRRLKRLVKRTNTPWLSDHLCWGSVDGRYTHDLLPMPYTREAVKVTDGPFSNFSGKVDEINVERGKLKVMVTIFGRPTPVELEFGQVEKEG